MSSSSTGYFRGRPYCSLDGILLHLCRVTERSVTGCEERNGGPSPEGWLCELGGFPGTSREMLWGTEALVELACLVCKPGLDS